MKKQLGKLIDLEAFCKEHEGKVIQIACTIPDGSISRTNALDIAFPKKFIVSSIGSNGGQEYFIYYMEESDGFKRKSAYFNNKIKMYELDPKNTSVIMQKFEKQQRKELYNYLTHGFMVGSDPEIFVEDNKKEVIPAFNFLKSKTDKNRHLTRDTRGVYWDGFQAEFETRPDNCLAYHCDSVQAGLTTTLSVAKNYQKDAKLSLQTVMNIPQSILESADKEHVSLGCMPSLNVYGHKGIQVEDPRQLPNRSAGGHIHFGIGNKKSKESIEKMVKALDAILGVACVALFQKYDNPVRRRYYGLAGEYRLPAHGLEYRTLSNVWLSHPMIMHIVFDLARKALVFGEKGFLKYWKATEEETVDCINNCDVAKAQEIMTRNKELLIQMFMAAYGFGLSKKYYEALFNVFYKGLQTIIQNPEDIDNNWCLTNGNWVRHSETEGKTFKKSIALIVAGKKVA